jgi:uncharacterized hydrophobic protein (TIGR00271 family)
MSTATAGSNARKRGKWARWWRIGVVGGVDHAAVLKQVREESGWTSRYAWMLGLLMPSVAVLIGAMLISPLMMPIIGLGFAIAMLDFAEIRRSLTALAAGAAIAILLSIVMVSLSPIQTITVEIAGRTRPTLFDLLVALLSAVAGGYALIRGRGGTVVGVAIAIALMPPLAVVGFGIATLNGTVAGGAALLFFTNLLTIALTAALVARVYGFGSHLSPRHTGWQLALFVVVLGALSIPLAAALKRIAFEAVAERQIREALRTRFPAGARLSQVDIDHAAQPLRVRAIMLTPKADAAADTALTAAIGRTLRRPVDVHVDQIATSDADAESTQIARATGTTGLAGRAAPDRLAEEVALIAGRDAAAGGVDRSARTIRVAAEALPGLGLAGYRALERRAAARVAGWTVMLAPPDDAPLPPLAVTDGVIDDVALGEAAWGSARLARAVTVRGGTLARRRAVAAAIVGRGGAAETGPAGGALRLEWAGSR